MRASFRRTAIAVLVLVPALGCAAPPAARASEDLEEAGAERAPAPAAEAPAAGVAERQALLRAKLATALGQLAPIRTMMTEHFFMTGAWPATPAEIGLDPEQMRSSVIAGVSLARDGTIAARLAPDIGADVSLHLTPQPVMGGTSLEWKCRANLPPSLLRPLSCEAVR